MSNYVSTTQKLQHIVSGMKVILVFNKSFGLFILLKTVDDKWKILYQQSAEKVGSALGPLEMIFQMRILF